MQPSWANGTRSPKHNSASISPCKSKYYPSSFPPVIRYEEKEARASSHDDYGQKESSYRGYCSAICAVPDVKPSTLEIPNFQLKDMAVSLC